MIGIVKESSTSVIKISFHQYTDERRTFIDVSYVPGLGFDLYSLHAVQRTNIVISDASGVHIIGTNVMSSRNSSGSCLCAPLLPTRTVGAKRKAESTNANDILRHPVSPSPSETLSNICMVTVSGSEASSKSDMLYAGLVEPMSRPPLRVRENRFWHKVK